MSDSTINLRIALSATQGNVMSVISSIAGALGGGGLVGVLGGIAVAAGVVGVASTRAAGQFQTAMLASVGHAGLAKDQVQRVTDAILQMGPAVGQMPTDLANAIYPIYSGLSGISERAGKSALALVDLQMAGKSVAGTTANLNDVAYAATSTFNAFGMATNNQATNIARMNQIYDQMNQAVSDGNMKMGDFSRVAGGLANATKQAGFQLSEGYAALDVFTNSGMGAQRASTNLGMLFMTLSTKTDTLAKNFDKLHTISGKTAAYDTLGTKLKLVHGHLEQVAAIVHHHGTAWKITGEQFDKAGFSAMNLVDKIKYLNKITSEHGETRQQQQSELLKMFGGNSRVLTSYNELYTNLPNLQANQKDIQGSKGATNTAFDTASQGIEFKMKQAQAAFSSFMISIGNALLPVATQLMGALAPLITRFSAWVQQSGVMKTIAAGLAGALGLVVGAITTIVTVGANIIGFFQNNSLAADGLKAVLAGVAAGVLAFAATAIPALVVGFGTWAVAAGAAAIATLAATWPFIAIGAVVAAVVFGIIEAVQHWGAIAHWLQGIWGGIVGFFKGLWNGIVAVWGVVADWFRGIFQAAWQVIVTVFSPVLDFFKFMWQSLVITFSPVVQWFGDRFRDAWNIIVTVFTPVLGFFKGVWNGIVAVFTVVGGWFHDRFMDAWNAISKVFGAIGQWFGDRWQDIVKAFAGAFKWAQGIAQDIWNAFTSGLATIGQWFLDHVVGPIKGAWQGVLDFLNPAGAATGSAIKQVLQAQITDWQHKHPGQAIPDNLKKAAHDNGIPGYAAGVTNFAGGLAYVHAGELLVNMPRGTDVKRAGSFGGGGHTTVHIGNITINAPFGNPSDVSHMVDLLEVEMARRFRSQTPSYSGSII